MFRQVKYDYVRQNLKILFDLLQLNFIERKKDNSHFKILNLEPFITAVVSIGLFNSHFVRFRTMECVQTY